MTATERAKRSDALYYETVSVTRRVLCDMIANREGDIDDLRNLVRDALICVHDSRRKGGRMMAFIAGFVIGGMFGVTVTALCAVGADRPTAPRVIVSDEETDCATGYCTCGACGEPIDPWDGWCKHCGARMGDA